MLNIKDSHILWESFSFMQYLYLICKNSFLSLAFKMKTKTNHTWWWNFSNLRS